VLIEQEPIAKVHGSRKSMILTLLSEGKQSLPDLHRRRPARMGRRGDANEKQGKRAILCAEDFCNRLVLAF